MVQKDDFTIPVYIKIGKHKFKGFIDAIQPNSKGNTCYVSVCFLSYDADERIGPVIERIVLPMPMKKVKQK